MRTASIMLLDELPVVVRDQLQRSHPGATGVTLEETASTQDVDQVGQQIKLKGVLITAYFHRSNYKLLIRMVDTNNNWCVHWYKVLEVLVA